jgi:hypothetical protein
MKKCLERTLHKFLSLRELDKPIASMYNGRMITGVASKHLTRSGVMYRRLLKLNYQLKNQGA